jgi:transposase-like protein
VIKRFCILHRAILRDKPGKVTEPDEVVVTIYGKKHWLWRAVDRHGAVLDVLVQSRRDRHAARRLMRKLLRKHGRAPRDLIDHRQA